MKKTNRSSHDELNLTNYSAMKNILYCLNNTVKCHFPFLCWCSLKILIGTLIPILTTILPKIVIEMITAKQSVYNWHLPFSALWAALPFYPVPTNF